MRVLLNTTLIGVLLALGGVAPKVSAQLDPASSLLLKNRAAETQGYNLNSGRYTVRPNPDIEGRANYEVIEVPNDQDIDSSTSKTAADKKSISETDSTPVQTESTINPDEKENTAQDKNKIIEKAADEKADNPKKSGIETKIKDLVLGGGETEIAKFRSQLSDSDVRKNILEVSVAPSFIYNDSSSNYWFRDYSTAGPGLMLEADFWVTPFFAVDMNYTTSFTTSVRANPSGSKFVSITHDWFGGGVKFRRFLGSSERTPSLTFGINYEEYQFKVPSAEMQRVQTKTSGVKLTLDYDVPTSSHSSLQLGTAIMPRNEHREMRAGADIASGTDNSTSAVQLQVGQTFLFSRQSQLFWRLSHRVEKNIFEGDANQVDPQSQVTPGGVSVSNSFTVFSLGFTWAN